MSWGERNVGENKYKAQDTISYPTVLQQEKNTCMYRLPGVMSTKLDPFSNVLLYPYEPSEQTYPSGSFLDHESLPLRIGLPHYSRSRNQVNRLDRARRQQAP